MGIMVRLPPEAIIVRIMVAGFPAKAVVFAAGATCDLSSSKLMFIISSIDEFCDMMAAVECGGRLARGDRCPCSMATLGG